MTQNQEDFTPLATGEFNRYVIVRSDNTIVTEAFYAQSSKEALARRNELMADGQHEWRIYQRLDV